jgi:hypothetical protein
MHAAGRMVDHLDESPHEIRDAPRLFTSLYRACQRLGGLSRLTVSTARACGMSESLMGATIQEAHSMCSHDVREIAGLEYQIRFLHDRLRVRLAQIERLEQLWKDAETRYTAACHERDWWRAQYHEVVTPQRLVE